MGRLLDFLFSNEQGWTWSGNYEFDDKHTSVDTTDTEPPERSYSEVYGDFVGSIHEAVEAGPEQGDADPDAEGDSEGQGEGGDQ